MHGDRLPEGLSEILQKLLMRQDVTGSADDMDVARRGLRWDRVNRFPHLDLPRQNQSCNKNVDRVNIGL